MIFKLVPGEPRGEMIGRIQRIIEALEDLERSSGWKLLVQDLEEQSIAALDAVDAGKSDPVECLRVLAERGVMKRVVTWATKNHQVMTWQLEKLRAEK